MAEVRGYTVQARSTDTFGRVLCHTRNHHFIVDGPVQNGCPGEALTPAELFLAGIAARSGPIRPPGSAPGAPGCSLLLPPSLW